MPAIIFLGVNCKFVCCKSTHAFKCIFKQWIWLTFVIVCFPNYIIKCYGHPKTAAYCTLCHANIFMHEKLIVQRVIPNLHTQVCKYQLLWISFDFVATDWANKKAERQYVCVCVCLRECFDEIKSRWGKSTRITHKSVSSRVRSKTIGMYEKNCFNFSNVGTLLIILLNPWLLTHSNSTFSIPFVACQPQSAM